MGEPCSRPPPRPHRPNPRRGRRRGRQVLAELLAFEGFVVRAAGTPARALVLLAAAPADLVVLDDLLAGGTAAEVVGWLRARRERAGTPVLLLTATTDPEAAARQVGADAWLANPYESDELLATIAGLLRRRA